MHSSQLTASNEQPFGLTRTHWGSRCIIPAIRRLSHLPILVDPSHGTGRRDSVLPMARAAIATGADGIMVEVHHQPEKALSDGPQSIYPAQFVTMMDEIEQIASVVARHLPRGIHFAAEV